MSFLSKLRDGKYIARLTWQDLDETTGTLAELRKWVDELIKAHGEDATFEIEHPDEGGRASYSIERTATEAEVQAYEKRQEQARKDGEARRRAEYEKLRKEFGG